MKLNIIAALVATISFVAPVKAQNTQLVTPSSAITQVSSEQVIEACVQDQAETLPNPFTDVPSNHWAFKSVLTMYYCGAYQGSIAPNKVRQLLQQQQPKG